MRVADVFMAYPFMLLTISVIAVLGNSIFNLILVLGLSDWVTYARTIRGSVLSIKEKEFVLAARSVGTRNRVILLRHVFPNVLSPILVLGTVRVANIIIWESGLSFLGMGVPPPMPTWGRMLAEGRVYITDAWWLVTLPGLAIMLTILSINLLGDGLRDALDPRLGTYPQANHSEGASSAVKASRVSASGLQGKAVVHDLEQSAAVTRDRGRGRRGRHRPGPTSRRRATARCGWCR
ncbi:MAG: ABC transporter permease [Desulfomicrobium escambiense]|nr:ABC transporter permease [Desulfomicrobium escambiense]